MHASNAALQTDWSASLGVRSSMSFASEVDLSIPLVCPTAAGDEQAASITAL